MWSREASLKKETDTATADRRAASAGSPVDERRVVAWIGKSVIFKGEFVGSEDMTIDGRVEGTIEVRDHGLTFGPDADIRADVVAQSVIVRGSVTGKITASHKVEVCETGSVEGDIISPRLAMAEGAVVRGRIDTLTRHTEANTLRPRLAVVG